MTYLFSLIHTYLLFYLYLMLNFLSIVLFLKLYCILCIHVDYLSKINILLLNVLATVPLRSGFKQCSQYSCMKCQGV